MALIDLPNDHSIDIHEDVKGELVSHRELVKKISSALSTYSEVVSASSFPKLIYTSTSYELFEIIERLNKELPEETYIEIYRYD